MSIFDTEQGRKALEKVGHIEYRCEVEPIRIVAMIDWLQTYWRWVQITAVASGRVWIYLSRSLEPRFSKVVWEELFTEPTRAEARIAAVNATPASQPVGKEGE